MTCRACGAEIAANAIVCYRCGAPTLVPSPAAPPAARRRRPVWPVLLAVALAVAAAVWFFLVRGR